MWFSYELRLFIELYRALTFIMMFLGMAFGLYWGTHHRQPSEHIHLDRELSEIAGNSIIGNGRFTWIYRSICRGIYSHSLWKISETN